MNPRPLRCERSALPLSYTPINSDFTTKSECSNAQNDNVAADLQVGLLHVVARSNIRQRDEAIYKKLPRSLVCYTHFMKSRLAELIHLKTSPVAILWTDDKPAGAIQCKQGTWACIIPFLVKAANGKIVAFDKKTTTCSGGRTGLGFSRYEPGSIEYFLSTGENGEEGERYWKTPELAREFIKNLPEMRLPTKYVVLKPLEQADIEKDEIPKAVILLVNPDQLSGLITLANYDRPTGDNVVHYAGAGCHSTVLFPILEAESKYPKAIIGLTDISARKYVPKDTLSFSVPYRRFLELEANAPESFLKMQEWKDIANR